MKMLILILICMLMTSMTFAGDILRCKQPAGCEKIVDSEYSTGGGEKAFILYEVGCLDKNGKYVKYMTKMTSVSGMFGFGRWTIPEKITFVKSNVDKLECK